MRHVLSTDRQDGKHALYAAGSTGAPFPSGPKATTQDELLLVGPSELVGLLAPAPPQTDGAPHPAVQVSGDRPVRLSSRRTTSLSISLRSDHSQFLIGGRVVVGRRAANQ